MGFGKLAINDYRVKDYRISRMPAKGNSFGTFYVFCLLRGMGSDPDTIMKYQVMKD